MVPNFGKAFFTKYQAKLVAFANSWLGRWFFKLNKVELPKAARIMEVGPGHASYDWKYDWKTGQLIKTSMFFTSNRFQRRLEYVYSKAAAVVGSFAAFKLMNPVGALGFLPMVALTTTTFFPDANVESTSVDGGVSHWYAVASGVDWATLIAAAGTHAAPSSAGIDDGTNTDGLKMGCDSVTDKYVGMCRFICLFDTSAIGDTDTISAATLSIRGTVKEDSAGVAPTFNIYTSAPASNTDVVAGDYDSFGSVAQSDTAITYAGYSTTGYNDWAFNATGIGNISKTGVSKFGLRNANYDAAGVAPTWSSFATFEIRGNSADTADTTSDPKLVVTHAASGPANEKTWNGVAKASVKTHNGTAIASVKTWNGVV